MLVDSAGELVVVYDYEDDNVYVYDVSQPQIKGWTRGRSVVYPTAVRRIDPQTIELDETSRHSGKQTTQTMKIE
jgi:hypothetical protein